ncbi:O-antigen ligase [Brachybacterium sp. FME24]|uniref:O-antigen ligase family protein n=1 Tax=Brachybacterium sp. FME24 TaxID=2742605 RepID=UPI001867891F|nr:O-antigen ligase family protein [Brachybacterium sp. FME24]
MSTAHPLQRVRPPEVLPAGRRRTPGGGTATRSPSDVLIAALIIAFGVALNHSSVILGFNLSLADPIAALLALAFIAARRMWVPPAPLLFFLLLSVHQIGVALLLAPRWTQAPLPYTAILDDYLKLGATFLCLLLGMQVIRAGHTRLLLRAYITGSVAVSSVAVASIALPALTSLGDLFYGGFRFQGLTNDPNYFAVMTVAALAALWYDSEIRAPLRVAASVFLIGGVLLSASKTGAIALALLVIWRVLGLHTAEDGAPRPRRFAIPGAVLGATSIALLLIPSSGIGGSLAEIVARTPALERLAPLLTDFDAAIGAGGSERGDAWAVAVAIILFSPLLGVGVGTYLTVAEKISGNEVLAHNTYLQIAAEWGLVFAIVLFVLIARYTLLRPSSASHRAAWAISSNALLVLLVGSLGLSLNNSRLLWVLFGVTIAAHLLSRPASSLRDMARGNSSPNTGTVHDTRALRRQPLDEPPGGEA